MKKILTHTLLTLLVLTSAPAALRAQRFETVERRNAWNAGPDRAGLRGDTLSVSYAEVWAGKQNGAFTDHSRSADGFSAGVRTESIRHFKKISFAGGFSYDYFQGQEMCGSMFIHPGYYPFDIYEFTPGRKNRETYAFRGEMAVELGRQWRGGLLVDFAAANYAKRKDLRHKNTRLDFEIAPSVQWHAGDWAVGAAYLFGKNSERIEATEIGSTPLSYEAFFDKGLFYGDRNLWTGSNIHLTDPGITAFPVRELMHGASLELQWRMLYADLTYRHRSGDTGEKGTVWHEFGGDGLEAHLVAFFGPGRSRHFVRATVGWNRRDSEESVLSRETTGGVTNTFVWGTVPVYAERSLSSRLEWEWMCGASDLRFGADFDLLRRQSSLLWPEVREESLRSWSIWSEGIWAVGRVELSGGLSVGWGSCADRERTTGDTAVASAYPERLDSYADWSREYRTATRLGCLFGVRVNVVKGFYVDASARYEHGFDLQYIPQPNRVEAVLALGYKW